ncbi:MAG: hypothetical protein ACR9NN_10160 [Nostochopsis sp.]
MVVGSCLEQLPTTGSTIVSGGNGVRLWDIKFEFWAVRPLAVRPLAVRPLAVRPLAVRPLAVRPLPTNHQQTTTNKQETTTSPSLLNFPDDF